MNTKYTIILIVIAALLFTHDVHAVTPTASTSATPKPTQEETPVDSTIKSLKEKIESKVEEINKQTKKVVKGTISSIKGDSIQLESQNGTKYTVTLDDTITTFYSASADGLEEAKQSDLSKGDTILVQGPEIEEQVTANVVYIQPNYLVISGEVTATDKDAFTVSIITQSKEQFTLDIEKGTTQYIMNSKDVSLAKSGFSKFKVGDRIHAVIEKPEDSAKTVTAIRTLIIPQEYFSEELTSGVKQKVREP